ncbi:lipid-A-disaccharide synthase [Amphritea sp. 2_MG-2023]|uniref:lipid-A-disaccharide synthase n=1 Tax=Amphritea TaxID=515417 RepID=UPI001C06E79B|nr:MULTISPECIES: lipid-A-disaccharide synthase [Amphritea]MBU2964890.1 lipid-A-disaccharide synthase [Amphritea atlantica]MDO6419947.1 lipid-A-disaccharide synthase [Amphritea sp. 2_MG-2023]
MSTLRIGIVAGEASGDILGASLLAELKHRFPDITFEGIGGELMQAEGCVSLFPMERLSVMGLFEVLGRLRELLGIRKSLVTHFSQQPPDIFIGIDSPDFTLNLEGKLRQAGIPTVHYVSPSVWAWRSKRVFKILKTTDLMLTLFPFEAKFYQRHGMPVEFVGHPLANMIPLEPDQSAARSSLNLPHGQRIVALMPGSRGGELKYLAEPFLDTARWLLKRNADLVFVMPAANQERYDHLRELIDRQYSDLPIILVLKRSREVLTAADAVLIASGTATLEALLLKKPMVVAYRMAPLSYKILSRLVSSQYISLPNLLADAPLVPEILQNDVRPEVLGPAIEQALLDSDGQSELKQRFSEIHQQLRQDASKKAVDAIVKLLESRGRLNGDTNV